MAGTSPEAARQILLVGGDRSLSYSLGYCLEIEGYRVVNAETGQQALQLFSRHVPDLVLLDILLPDVSGLDVCRKIRSDARGERPAIIIITAKTEEIDRVAGFEAGADDFVSKPFSSGELMLRIQARLQARAPGRGRPTQTCPDGPSNVLVFGPLQIDRDSHRVFLSGHELALSVQEMRLLDYLASQPNRMHARKDLLSAVWGYHPDASSRTLDTHIKRLRDKFGDLATMIQTVHGIGYRLVLPSPAVSSHRARRRR